MGLLATVALLAVAIAGGTAAADDGPPYLGRPLAEVLGELGDRGLTLVFTSEVVTPDLVVVEEPGAGDARRLLDRVLEPHGLLAVEAPGGVLVVVRARRSGRIEGRVEAEDIGAEAAVVRLTGEGRTAETTTAADGTFAVSDLPAGEYTLTVQAPGYLDERLDGLALAPGATRRVIVSLSAPPYLRDEIVVRPSRLSLLRERPDSPFSLSREDIDRLPHLGGDVFRAVSLLPGIAANDVTARFSVHGGRRDEVRVVLDGQELYDPYHLKDYDGALSIVAVDALAGASLTTGAFPASQGDRMSAVLDLRTADPPERRRTLLGVSALSALATSSGSFGRGRGGWLVTARRGSLDLARHAVGDEDPGFWDVLGKGELNGTGVGDLAVHLLSAGDELELDRSDEDGFERLENDYRSDYAWITHRLLTTDRLLVETVVSRSSLRRDRGGVGSEEEGSFALRDRRDLEVVGVSQSWGFQGDAGRSLEWGWEARHYDARFDYASGVEPEFVVLPPGAEPRSNVRRFDGHRRSDHLAAWISRRHALTPRLTAELGVRFDHHSATADDLVSPRVNLAWRAGERGVLRAAWGRFFQSQRPYELQVEDGMTTLSPAERSEHWVVGYEALLDRRSPAVEAVRVELFHRRIDDPRPRFENLLEPLNFFPEIEPDRVRIAPRSSSAEGIEVSLRGRRGPRFDWWLAYTRSRARDRIAGRTVPRSLDQPHSLAVNLGFRLPRRWDLHLAWRYHTGWPTTAVSGAPLADPDDPEGEPALAVVFGRLNGERLSPYHRLDLRASRRWPLRCGSLTVYVDVQNAYDRANAAGFDLAVDADEGSVEREPETWPGVVPSLGVTWQF